MPTIITQPAPIPGTGNLPKQIEEFIGRVNSGTEEVSICRMKSPSGWEEPGQRPEFNEYLVVLQGMLRVTTPTDTLDVHAGQAIISHLGKWVRYSTPGEEGAEYLSVCLPAFSKETVNPDNE